ncbi:MAG: hypothetical protein ACI4PR_03675 [Acutalibacteraceae bacterium]
MKLSKKLLAGSMALMLSLGNLHAMEGQNPANLRNATNNAVAQSLRPQYQFCVSHQQAYDLWRNGVINNPYANIRMLKENNGTFFAMSREHNRSESVIEFVNTIKDALEIYREVVDTDKMDDITKSFLYFIGDILRVRKIYPIDNDELQSGDWIHYTIKDVLDESIDNRYSNEIHFEVLEPDSKKDIRDFCVVYSQQLFLLPFEIGTGRVYLPEFKNMLSHLLKNLGVLTILLPNNHWVHLTGLDAESGDCKFVGSDSTEYYKNIRTFADSLANEKQVYLNVCYLNKIPKNNRLLVRYTDGGRIWWDTFHWSGPWSGSSDDEFESESDSDLDIE